MDDIALVEWTPPAGGFGDGRIGTVVPSGSVRPRVTPSHHGGGSVRYRTVDRRPSTGPRQVPDDAPTDVLPAYREPLAEPVVPAAADDGPASDADVPPIEVTVEVPYWMIGPDGALKPNVTACRRLRREMLLHYQASRATGVAVRWQVAGPRAAEAVRALIDDGLYGDRIDVTVQVAQQ